MPSPETADRVDELAKKTIEAEIDLGAAKTEWYRHIVTVASGALVVLAGFRSYQINSSAEAYLMAFTWVFLATGIVAGAIAGYLKTGLYEIQYIFSRWELMREADNFGGMQELERDQDKHEQIRGRLKTAQKFMFWSLSLAMVTFCAYAIVWAFSVEPPVVDASQAVIADQIAEQE